jgi:hypothetical protein
LVLEMIENRLLRIAWQIGGFIVLVAVQRLPHRPGLPQPAPILVVIDGSGPQWRRQP